MTEDKNSMKTKSISASLVVLAQTIATARHLIFRRAFPWAGFMAFAMIASGLQPAQTAVTEAWVQRYSNVVTNSKDYAVKVVRDATGDIIVTGIIAGSVRGAGMGIINTFTGADMLTIKYSGSNGAALWQRRY